MSLTTALELGIVSYIGSSPILWYILGPVVRVLLMVQLAGSVRPARLVSRASRRRERAAVSARPQCLSTLPTRASRRRSCT